MVKLSYDVRSRFLSIGQVRFCFVNLTRVPNANILMKLSALNNAVKIILNMCNACSN